MKVALIVVYLFLFISCKIENISPSKLVGIWNSSYQIQNRDGNGKWSDWTTLNTFIALQTLQFTKKGEILWNGKQSDNCCTPRSFTIKDINIISVKNGNINCAAVTCLANHYWIIEKLTSDTLEINQFYSKVRYIKIKK